VSVTVPEGGALASQAAAAHLGACLLAVTQLLHAAFTAHRDRKPWNFPS